MRPRRGLRVQLLHQRAGEPVQLPHTPRPGLLRQQRIHRLDPAHPPAFTLDGDQFFADPLPEVAVGADRDVHVPAQHRPRGVGGADDFQVTGVRVEQLRGGGVPARGAMVDAEGVLLERDRRHPRPRLRHHIIPGIHRGQGPEPGRGEAALQGGDLPGQRPQLPRRQRRVPHPHQHRQTVPDHSQRRRRELRHHISDHLGRVSSGARRVDAVDAVGTFRAVGVERLLLVAAPVSHGTDARPHHRQTQLIQVQDREDDLQILMTCQTRVTCMEQERRGDRAGYGELQQRGWTSRPRSSRSPRSARASSSPDDRSYGVHSRRPCSSRTSRARDRAPGEASAASTQRGEALAGPDDRLCAGLVEHLEAERRGRCRSSPASSPLQIAWSSGAGRAVRRPRHGPLAGWWAWIGGVP